MGQRMSPKPHIYDRNCPIGFPVGETPKYLYVRFSQIVKCPDVPPVFFAIPPNDRTFKLTQDAIFNCLWEITTEPWHVIVDAQFNPPFIILWLEHLPDGRVYFYDVPESPIDEGTVYNNRNIACGLGPPASGGIATITWTQEATNLLAALNIQRANDLFMEMRPLVDGNKVYKFCRLQDATNISIEYEPD